MRKREREMWKDVGKILMQNIPPDTEREERKKETLARLGRDVRNMDYRDVPSFPKLVLTQLSYFSHRMWLVQVCVPVFLFLLDYQSGYLHKAAYTICLVPGLALPFFRELYRVYSHNMWEMEAACRYNLPRLLLFRLCILSGVDLIVLSCSLAVFCRRGGVLWEYALYVLLPFFLTAAFCLLILRHFGNGGEAVGLTAACLMPLGMISLTRFPLPETVSEWIQGAVLAATLASLLLLLRNAYRLCSTQYYEIYREEPVSWN